MHQVLPKAHFASSAAHVQVLSDYAVEAIEIHGAFKGSLMALGRLLRCNQLFKGGYDPVPPKKEKGRKE